MLTDDEVKHHIDRNQTLKGIRQLYEPLWEEIAEYIFPRRVGIGYKPTEGQKQTYKMYDSTAEFSLNALAAVMQGTITPSSSVWSSFKLRNDSLNKRKDVMDWIEACVNAMTLARHQSNFTSQMHEGFLDSPGFGQMCLRIEEKTINGFGFQGFKYTCMQNSMYCTAEDANGKVDTIYWEDEFSADQAVKKWGDKVPEKIMDEAKKKPDTKFNFLTCIYPSNQEFGQKKGQKPWVSYTFSLEEKAYITESSFWEFPVIVPRWSKASGEAYGRGRGHIALPDVKTLNKAKEFGLKAWAKDLDPPTFEKDGGVIGSLKLWPGGRNIARDKESIWTMDHKIRYDVSQIKEEDLRSSISKIFFADQLQLPEKSDMREMEVAVRYELMQRILGPTLGRFESEGLNPLIEREFAIMMRATSGKYPVLPTPPPIMQEMGFKEIDIEYEGPMARAQRRQEMTGIDRMIGRGAQLTQGFGPQVLDNFDSDKIIRYSAEIEGMPSHLMNPEEKVAVIRQQRAKAMAEEKQKQDLERMAAGAKDAAPFLKQMGEAQNATETPA